MTTDTAITRQERAAALVLEHVRFGREGTYDARTPDHVAARFRDVGFFRSVETIAELDGVPTIIRRLDFADTRPREPMLLFRGCDAGQQHRPSWSSSPGVAVTYSPGGLFGALHPTAHLFTVVAPPERVLAIINDEWVLDIADLPITDHGPVRYHEPRSVRLADVALHPEQAYLLDTLGPNHPIRVLPDATLAL
jgi:hypothetical protein